MLAFLLNDAVCGDIMAVAGAHGIYGPGSNIVECAADVRRLLVHNMPPVGD
jgi:methylmalonyl-CoA mutase